jgi:hypothetical protein
LADAAMRGPLAAPDWRDADGYAALLDAAPEALAWEWLRRDPLYRAASIGRPSTGGASRELIADPAASRWGLLAFEDPGRPAGQARPVWRREALAGVLLADATASGDASERFNLARFAGLATVVRSLSGAEHVLLSDGVAGLRLDILSGSLVAGPACLSYRLAGLSGLRAPLATLSALVRLWQVGRLAPASPGERNRRRVLLLRAADGLGQGATQRELAAVLLGREAALARWRSEVPSLRSRAQRLVAGARTMAGGGWRALLTR